MNTELRDAIGKALYESSADFTDSRAPQWETLASKEEWMLRAEKVAEALLQSMEGFRMTPEQSQLVLQILSGLGKNAMTYEEVEYGHIGHCKHCDGQEEGWPDSHDFEHEPDCIVLLIDKLQATVRAERGKE